MRKREIPKDSWDSFLESFSRQHELWRAALSIVDPSVDAQAEICELPLLRIARKGGDICITLRTAERHETTQVAARPARMLLEETEEGAHKSLQIESADGIRTILSFRAAVLPETLDGIVDR